MITTISLPSTTLVINSANISNAPSPVMNESGSITNLFVNGTFQIASGSSVGYYSANFPLTSSSDLSSSIADLNTLVQAKVINALGL
jgi:hypothetical protein